MLSLSKKQKTSFPVSPFQKTQRLRRRRSNADNWLHHPPSETYDEEESITWQSASIIYTFSVSATLGLHWRAVPPATIPFALLRYPALHHTPWISLKCIIFYTHWLKNQLPKMSKAFRKNKR